MTGPAARNHPFGSDRTTEAKREQLGADDQEQAALARLAVLRRLRDHQRHLVACAATAAAVGAHRRLVDLGGRITAAGLVGLLLDAERDDDQERVHGLELEVRATRRRVA